MKDLTGQCKVDFEKWFNSLWVTPQEIDYKEYVLHEFDNKGMAMKWGVYQDFFDSVGIDVYIETNPFNLAGSYTYHVVEIHDGNFYENTEFERPEARTAAINKANELFNQKNK